MRFSDKHHSLVENFNQNSTSKANTKMKNKPFSRKLEYRNSTPQDMILKIIVVNFTDVHAFKCNEMYYVKI